MVLITKQCSAMLCKHKGRRLMLHTIALDNADYHPGTRLYSMEVV